jgi:hypothetical protein
MARQRPPHLKPPAYLAKSPPVPEPGAPAVSAETGGPKGHEPTRYGDWERKGICWDF